jgi:hypothetical protein
MYSGFVSPHKTITRIGIHQRFDSAAYRMIEPLLPPDFLPPLAEILEFEGFNGPDGLKVKSPGVNEPSHLYDPATDTGQVPANIQMHFDNLVLALKAKDEVRASFEAAWMCHYVCDGLTPAHHWPLEEALAEADAPPLVLPVGDNAKRFSAQIKKQWLIWGAKGHLSTHHNFELGIVFALAAVTIKGKFDLAELQQARADGPVDYFKRQARHVAELDLYGKFYKHGWTTEIAKGIKNVIAPVSARTIGLILLLAAEAAGGQLRLPGAEPKPDQS